MKRAYWENMAASYHDEIFDVRAHDKKGLIYSAIQANAGPDKTVADIGCAIGKWLPLLSPLFKKVIALDISQKNLDIARTLHPQLTNIAYVRADMSGKSRQGLRADFALCINAILTPDQKDRDRFFASLGDSVKRGGRIVITVPSLESHLLTSVLQKQFGIDKRWFPDEKNGREALRKWNQLRRGNADIDEVPHKHYLREELALLLRLNGWETEQIEKLEYPWTTEFHHPPDWLKEPGPWDWMVVGRKK